MTAPPTVQRGEVEEQLYEPWGYLFNRPNQRGAFRSPLAVRRSTLRLAARSVAPPLFSGECEFSRYVRRQLDAETRAWISLNFWLNPTRYIRHQSPAPFPEEADGEWPNPRLFASKAPPNARDEIVLNNNDNWIPQSQRLDAFTDPIRWARHLSNYVNAVPALFEQELARAQGNVPLVRIDYEDQTLNLQLAETYWEFTSENPTALVASLVPLFRSFSSLYRETSEFRQEFDTGINHNALSLYAEVNRGRAIRIYAKTNRRVRVEVIHTFGGRSGYQFPGGHTLEAWSTLPTLLNDLTVDAAELVNRLFQHFRRQSEVTPSHITPYQLMVEICHGAGDVSTAIDITSLLVEIGPLAAIGSGIQRALQRLAQANVIEYNQEAQNYTVTAPRRHALELLRRNGNFTLLIARDRARENAEN